MVYVKSGRVHGVDLDPETMTVTGRVAGTYRDTYTVVVQLSLDRSGMLAISRSRCDCPMVTDCKHTAAVLVVARHLTTAATLTQRPAWEKTLDTLLATPTWSAATDAAPLALEFGVERVPAFRGYVGRQDLQIRPVRPGRSGTWVRSGISWDDLDFVARSYRASDRELLQQFRAAAGSSVRHALPRSSWLSLSTVGTRVWDLLDQATATGLTLIAAAPLTGPVRSSELTEIGLDAHRSPDGIDLRVWISAGDRSIDPATVGVLGEPTHGIFQVIPISQGVDEIRLTRLRQPISRELRKLVVDRAAIRVPAADESRFRAEFESALGRRMSLRSIDGSVLIASPVPPEPELTVSFEPDHRVELVWAMRYGGSAEHVFEIDSPVSRQHRVRDRAVEEQIFTGLDLPYAEFPDLAVPHSSPPRPSPRVRLSGPSGWRFVEEGLPRLREAGLAVRVRGEPVAYRNGTDNLTVEVSARSRADNADWFDLQVQLAMDGQEVPFAEVFRALSAGENHLILAGGVYVSLDEPQFARLRDLIEESATLRDEPPERLTITRAQASLWDDLVDLGAVVRQSAAWVDATRGLSELTSVEPVAPPQALAAELRPYQLEGYRWLTFLYNHRLGGILADDMGLGKTVQALALMCRVVEQHPEAPPFLVVAPTSVVSNWVHEAMRFAPELTVVALDSAGGSRNGSKPAARRTTSTEQMVDGANIVITSYARLRLDNPSLVARCWSGMLLDEAQFVKNHRSKTHQCARRIDTPFKLAMTGTPLENSLMDLWALLSITAPGLFPHERKFGDYYRRPIERDRDQTRLRQLRRRIRPLLLRRTKEAVAPELPPKQEQVVEVELHPRHRRLYQTQLQRERQKVLGLIEDVDSNRFQILRSLSLLRRLTLDPALIDPSYDSIPAAKVELLTTQLTELIRQGHQAVVFSQFTSFLRRIRGRLESEGIEFAYLDGSTRRRDDAVQSFKSGEKPVFLVSLKAGGFGLNLTEADYCFLLDPWWNPAAEAQAVDRTHRIGQTRTVMVYRYVAKDTIEEKVTALKARKKDLFSSVFESHGQAESRLTADDVRSLIGH